MSFQIVINTDGCFVLNLISYSVILWYSAPFDNWLGLHF